MIPTPFRRLAAPAAALVLALSVWAGCDLADPTGVQSPNIRESDFLDLPAIASVWLPGLERQASLAYDQFVAPAAIASDSYQNTSNFFVADDGLDFLNDRNDFVDDTQFSLADLREMATFGLERVRAEDESVTDDQLAEFHFFRGLAHLLSGMYFRTLPAEPGGAPVPDVEHYRLAIAAADEALALGSDADALPSYHMLKARALFYLGNAAEATAAADGALAAGGDAFVRYVVYDDVNLGTQGEGGNPDNEVQDGIFTRTTNDLQPLPRLDFADPKYTDYEKDAAADETDIPMFKAEEAYLIKAQAALAASDLGRAQDLMKAVVGIVEARPKRTIVDQFDPRRPYPEGTDESWTVRFSDDTDARAVTGLLLPRGSAAAEIVVSEISSTSVTESDIDGAASVDDALELLYLMRQEIFLVEGIRLPDLGVKWPIHETEALLNPAVTAEDREAFIPAFLPPPTVWDAFTAFPDQQLIVIEVNLNEVLVQNRTDEAVVPFF